MNDPLQSADFLLVAVICGLAFAALAVYALQWTWRQLVTWIKGPAMPGQRPLNPPRLRAPRRRRRS